MINFKKYRGYDRITINGLIADVYRENEEGELIGPLSCYALDDDYWSSYVTVQHGIVEQFDLQKWVFDWLSNRFELSSYSEIFVSAISNVISLWQCEDKNGLRNHNGEYYVMYQFEICINGDPVTPEDMLQLFPKFEF